MKAGMYLFFRLVIGLLFLQHGAMKLFGLFGSNAVKLSSLMGLVGLAEFVGGILIAIGLYVRFSALLCSALMIAAYYVAHAPKGIFPILNGGELAVLYLLSFLLLLFFGSGKLSLDRALE